jgi:hypothetical protein
MPHPVRDEIIVVAFKKHHPASCIYPGNDGWVLFRPAGTMVLWVCMFLEILRPSGTVGKG